MSHFYGEVQGGRGAATRCGSRNSGMTTWCASGRGAVRCRAYERDGKDYVMVTLARWQGRGGDALLYDGPIDASEAPQSDIIAALLAAFKLSEATQERVIKLVNAELMLRGV